jgi:hypothetical protein
MRPTVGVLPVGARMSMFLPGLRCGAALQRQRGMAKSQRALTCQPGSSRSRDGSGKGRRGRSGCSNPIRSSDMRSRSSISCCGKKSEGGPRRAGTAGTAGERGCGGRVQPPGYWVGKRMSRRSIRIWHATVSVTGRGTNHQVGGEWRRYHLLELGRGILAQQRQRHRKRQ